MTIKNISDVQHILYINLQDREDRKQHVEEQLRMVGFQNPERFNAVVMDIGAIGCSMSHLRCLETAREKNWDHVLICEDDVLFLNPELFTQQMNTFLENHDDWDVVFLGGHNNQQYIPVDDSCVQVHRCQTTTGYLVKSHYYDKLIDIMKEGVEMFIKEPHNFSIYAVDRYWFRLQELDKWYLIIPLSVTQKEDYSDIEKMSVNYHYYLLSLDT
jgi:GR25 family glycosyltransferase involved in LPS biosynthesis